MADIVDNIEEQFNEAKSISHLYEDWFLDYASYVILERAVPKHEDGLKPVQRRILHAMKEMDDGRFHKVANIIGQTMQFHPHGDAAIGDALVNMGQKDLLIDTQGNWGNIFTGDKTRCKCLDLGIKNKNPRIRIACIHQLILKVILEG